MLIWVLMDTRTIMLKTWFHWLKTDKTFTSLMHWTLILNIPILKALSSPIQRTEEWCYTITCYKIHTPHPLDPAPWSFRRWPWSHIHNYTLCKQSKGGGVKSFYMTQRIMGNCFKKFNLYILVKTCGWFKKDQKFIKNN